MLHLCLTATTEVQNTQHTIFLFIHVYKQRSVGLAQTASRLPDISPGHYLRDTNPIEHVNNTRNVTPITLRTFETPPCPPHPASFTLLFLYFRLFVFPVIAAAATVVWAFGSLPRAFVFVKQTSQERTTAVGQSCRRTRRTWAAGYFIRPPEVTWPSPYNTKQRNTRVVVATQ